MRNSRKKTLLFDFVLFVRVIFVVVVCVSNQLTNQPGNEKKYQCKSNNLKKQRISIGNSLELSKWIEKNKVHKIEMREHGLFCCFFFLFGSRLRNRCRAFNFRVIPFLVSLFYYSFSVVCLLDLHRKATGTFTIIVDTHSKSAI